MRGRAAVGALLALAGTLPLRGADLPWDVLGSPWALPRLAAGDQVLLRSSRCPSACRYDRTSAGDTRFLREEDGEQVLFEERGPGAIVRFWMTMGDGISKPLDPTVRLRIRVDGESAPRVDLPLPDLFSGVAPPFNPPLVAGRLAASGGNVSYVPIPYRAGCRVSLVNASNAKIWFQFVFHRLPIGTEVETFTGREDLTALRAALTSTDPWEAWGGERRESRLSLAPGASATALDEGGAGTLTDVALLTASSDALRLELSFDGEAESDVSVPGFFASGHGGRHPPDTLLLRERGGWLHAYFPMPFFRSVRIRVRNTGPERADVSVAVRLLRAAPPDDAGLFGAAEFRADPPAPPADTTLLDLAGRGKWVGLFAELGSVDGHYENYLEGDERVYVDGSPHPAHYGTGVEDLFNGGFFFDRGPYAIPQSAATYVFLPDRGNDTVTGAVRLLLGDAVPFDRSLAVRLENGPTGVSPMRVWSTAYFYSRREPALVPAAAVAAADPQAGATAGYRAAGDTCAPVASAFESEPPAAVTLGVCSRAGGRSRFRLPGNALAGRARLRRRFDAGTAGQAADVLVNGVLAGRFPPADANAFRRFRDQEIELALPPAGRAWDFEILPAPMAGEAFTEIGWELFTSPR